MRIVQRSILYCALAGITTLGSLVISPLAQAGAAKAARAVPFTVRLEDQILANLRYLPVAFVPRGSSTPTTTTTLPISTTTTTTVPGSTTTTTLGPTTTTTLPVSPTTIEAGNFVWRYPNLPRALQAQWSVGTNNVVLKGALMRFQDVHGLATTGQMDSTTWESIVSAARKHQIDPNPYTYVYVSQTQPETLTLYIDNYAFFSTAVNTGLSVAPTQSGTFPVYLRYTVTTMSGKEPDGKPYHDKGIPWVSYFNGGDALHGFIRGAYGYPQSLGCVEMTFAHAAIVWPHTPLGTLVTVAA